MVCGYFLKKNGSGWVAVTTVLWANDGIFGISECRNDEIFKLEI
jgi:hypothetical protein